MNNIVNRLLFYELTSLYSLRGLRNSFAPSLDSSQKSMSKSDNNYFAVVKLEILFK